MKKVSVSIYFDVRRKLKIGKYPLKLKVTYNRKTKFYPFIPTPMLPEVSFTEKEYENIIGVNQTRKGKEIERILKSVEQDTYLKAISISPFSFDKFEDILYGKEKNISKDIIEDLKVRMNEFTLTEQFGTIGTIKRTLIHLKNFIPEGKLLYTDITQNFLEKFEKWLLTNTEIKSVNTVAIYMRNIKTLCNNALKDGIINEKEYPFGKYKYQIPGLKKQTIKTLDIEDIRKLISYKSVSENRMKARDFWILSYLCNGMNIADIIRLKYSNLNDGKVIFIRKKSTRTRKSNQIIVECVLHEIAKEIIKKWGNKKKDSYIFPFINDDMDEQTKIKQVSKLNSFITKNIKKIAKELNINHNISAVYARHSFATILQNQGASIGYISKALGHSSIETTINYLGRFTDDNLKEFSAKLV